ncbi:MAG: hypothetical protein ACYS30_25265 [Planctomycetota bacterium]
MGTNNIIAGREIQIDHSGGYGHAWATVDVDDIPPQIRMEIEGEIIDGRRETVDDFVATNGRHYRWE